MYSTDDIHVKPYVAAYIKLHGVPRNERMLLLMLLAKKTERRKIEYVPGAVVRVVLSKDEFERYGCTLSRANMQVFCSAMELRIKQIFETELDARLRLPVAKLSYKDMILETRDRIGLDEDSLPFETIKKHLDRYRQRHNIEIKNKSMGIPSFLNYHHAAL
jgi:hypothetical protein